MRPTSRRYSLADGDALIMKTEDLLTILAAVKELFPRVTRVAAYRTAQDIPQKIGRRGAPVKRGRPGDCLCGSGDRR